MNFEKITALTAEERALVHQMERSELVKEFIAKMKNDVKVNRGGLDLDRSTTHQHLAKSVDGMLHVKTVLTTRDYCSKSTFECWQQFTLEMLHTSNSEFVPNIVIDTAVAQYALSDGVLHSRARVFTLKADIFVGRELAIDNAFSASWSTK